MVTLVTGQVGTETGQESGADQQPQHFLERLDRFERLAEELGRRGLHATLMAPAGRVPSLHVVNPTAARLAEDVYVGRSQDGMWWFWWPWAERIAPGDDVSQAATAIAKVLESDH
jgi:hypothetical protein